MDFRTIIFDTVLKDDSQKNGGKSYDNETLSDFLSETGISTDSMLGTINNALTECGILPINHFNYPKLFAYTFNDLKYYVAIHYDYMDCFNYTKNGNEQPLTFVEELIVQNIEKNTIQHPYEFGELVKDNDSLQLNGQRSF
ncbi:hypothetical protein SA58113_p20013 (plasmid) [Staphylococcus argenteus]|uniref:hypothetical protein n=1 Tax=Staphylococcus argenteus TaxID=985002 RepID=UPI000E3344ED|nr:hypothetical protein [Staphylococcus argenteus]BBD87457.1 hypothetical protein SA58113_p20013 [Staphylococcus argenteus]